MTYFFSDLDNTLVYSHRVSLPGERIAVEYLNDHIQSYMTKKTYDFSVNLMEYFSFLRQQELVNNMHVYLKPLPDLDADMHWFVTVEFY